MAWGATSLILGGAAKFRSKGSHAYPKTFRCWKSKRPWRKNRIGIRATVAGVSCSRSFQATIALQAAPSSGQSTKAARTVLTFGKCKQEKTVHPSVFSTWNCVLLISVCRMYVCAVEVLPRLIDLLTGSSLWLSVFFSLTITH
jgi:hypothetical protein